MLYLCTRKQKQRHMKNTEYNLDTLTNVISTESLQTLLEMVCDLDLEVTSVAR